MLTELVNINNPLQGVKVKENTGFPIELFQGQKYQSSKNNVQIAPRTKSAVVAARPNEPFALSLEMLSENLHDSVKMIKDLMGSNQKLKDLVNELSNIKKSQDAEIVQLHAENQNLIEKVESLENESSVVGKLQQEKQDLANRLSALERENRQAPVIFPTKERKTEWAWKSKRTIVRAGTYYIDSPGQFIDKDHYQRYQSVRPSTRVKMDRSAESTGPAKSESSPDSKTRDDTLSSLSVLYNKTRAKHNNTTF